MKKRTVTFVPPGNYKFTSGGEKSRGIVEVLECSVSKGLSTGGPVGKTPVKSVTEIEPNTYMVTMGNPVNTFTLTEISQWKKNVAQEMIDLGCVDGVIHL